jgi:hypothetical protein
MSGLHLGNLATGTGWGGNVGDYSLILIGTLATFAAAWFSMTGWGYEQFQNQASQGLRFHRIKEYILWLNKTKTNEAERWKANFDYVFGSFYLSYMFRVPSLTKPDKVTREQWKEAEYKYSRAMEVASYIEAGFSYFIGALLFVMVFMTWWTGLYDNASAIGPGTTVYGWVIALIVFDCLILLFHKTAAILCFANHAISRIIGYVLELIVIAFCLGSLVCSAVLATTEAWGFVGVAVVAFLLMVVIIFYFLWLLVHARIVLALWNWTQIVEEHMDSRRRKMVSAGTSE